MEEAREGGEGLEVGGDVFPDGCVGTAACFDCLVGGISCWRGGGGGLSGVEGGGRGIIGGERGDGRGSVRGEGRYGGLGIRRLHCRGEGGLVCVLFCEGDGGGGVGRERAGMRPRMEVGISPREDVVRHHRDRVLVPQRQAQRQHQRRLARSDRPE